MNNPLSTTPVVLFCLLCSGLVAAQPTVAIKLLDSTFSKPVQLVSAGDGTDELYIGEKNGPIYRYTLSSGQKELFFDMTGVDSRGEGGVCGMAFHPAYPDSNYLYITYTLNTTPTPDLIMRISRFSVGRDPERKTDWDSERILLEFTQPDTKQNGGGLEFGPDGYLYIGIGDGAGDNDPYEHAQNPRVFLGKMLRVDVDSRQDGRNYAIPPDNPFVTATDTFPEIWSLGLRNPYRFSFDRLTGDLWIGDKGEDFYEEVNFQAAGAGGGQNYGWNCREGFEESGAPGQRYCGDPTRTYDAPLLVFTHSSPTTNYVGGSVTAGFVYRGPDPSLQGLYIFGDFFQNSLFVFDPSADAPAEVTVQEEVIFQNLTTFGVGNDNALYGLDYNGGLYLFSAEPMTAVARPAPPAPPLVLAPNPARREVTLQLPPQFAPSVTVSLLTASGQQLRRWHDLPVGDGRLNLTLPDAPRGLYILACTDGLHTRTAKLLLQQ